MPQPNAPDGGDDEEEPRPARSHILITDGAQSTKQQRADVSCMAGSDYRCVRNAISNLLRRGWAGSVVGVRGGRGWRLREKGELEVK